MAQSFETYIGLLNVQKYPMYYHSFFSMSQVTNSEKSEKIAYQYMMNQYERKDDTSMVKKLKKYPIFNSESSL